MASFRAHLLSAVMRVQVKRRLGTVKDVRQVRDILGKSMVPAPKGARFVTGNAGGIPGEWVSFEAVTPSATLLYLHGGGYVACSPRTHRPITAAYAKHGLRVFAPDYRLAPEHPFPAAIEDAVAAYRAVRADADPAERFVLSGDSAGGGLALALLLKLRDLGLPMPDAAALFSPWTDLAVTGATIETNSARDAMFTGDAIRLGPPTYLAGADPRDPLASPLYADLHGLPPLLIHVGEREVLRDDSTRLAERARAAGVPVRVRVWPVVPHVWQIVGPMLPEARDSLQEAAAFLHGRAT
jgi:acetyl esterase/lipase